MQIVNTKSALQKALESSVGKPRGLVPTMGALHQGHLSLIEQARKEVGPDGLVIATIFVNPTQFGPNEDLDAYPRQLDSDLDACREHGVDLVYAPAVDDVYSDDASISIHEASLSRGLCGSSRPGHFDGVCLVVAKLFNLTQPTVAIFGEKDYQQLAVIRRMVRDLDFQIKIVAAPTIREPDGLAMSSRNAYLSKKERQQAPVIYQSLTELSQQIETEKDNLSVASAKQLLTEKIETSSDGRIDYLEIVHPETLQPLKSFSKKQGHRIIAAVFFGKTRLIDNFGPK